MTQRELIERTEAILRAHAGMEGALLPVLHAMQAEFGYVPEAAYATLCKALGASIAEVQGVVSFYHDFHTAPTGPHVLKICRAEACQASGAADLVTAARARLAVDWGETSASGVTLQPVYCLRLCACAPAIVLDGTLVARVDQAKLETLLQEIGA